jgi:hypothetical protein
VAHASSVTGPAAASTQDQVAYRGLPETRRREKAQSRVQSAKRKSAERRERGKEKKRKYIFFSAPISISLGEEERSTDAAAFALMETARRFNPADDDDERGGHSSSIQQ